jgi:hypothetical protein
MCSKTPDTLLEAMRKSEFYPHPAHTIQVIHTHISTIFLTGEFAYKIKKPVNFGFLDFTRLADRKHFCEEELRLNSRLAPKLYLAVVPILQVDGTYRMASSPEDHTGVTVEYAVKMRQFDPQQQLDRLLLAGMLPLEQMDTLAACIARFHQQAECASNTSHFGLPASLFAPMEQNFDILQQHLHAPEHNKLLAALQCWTQQTYQSLHSLLVQRKQDGYIRACHGDMHLGNIALVDGEITIFDGIEFNDNFRWIDTASEIAFLLMDLEDRHAPAHAHRALNVYLSETGDYGLLEVLNFYKVYRALVRAKVNALRLPQVSATVEREKCLRECTSYLRLAESYTHPRRPVLLITHGLSGSGKSRACRTLVDQLGLIQIRADVERKRLTATLTGQSLYSPAMTGHTYNRLADLATRILQTGHSVIVDATFLDAALRQHFRTLAQTSGAAFLILHLTATQEQLERNILHRQKLGNDPSDADIAVLHKQLAAYKPLQDDEPYVTVQPDEYLPLERIQAQLDRS